MRLFSCVFMVAGVLGAQSFEVATIKPNAAADNRISIGIHPGGRFEATGMSVKTLIAQAYDLREFQISGGPGWVESERFDIKAKAEALEQVRGPQAIRPYLQSLLKERFQLKMHEDQKEMPVYNLVVAKGGVKMKASEGGAERQGQVRMGRGQFTANGVPVGQLIRMLANPLRRPVIDKTGLTGNYDFQLEWAPEGAENGPTIFTAVQEQLGLKLEADKAPGKVLVIDSIEKPSEN